MRELPVADLLEGVRAAVVEAGDRALSLWGRVAPELKEDETFVTDVDRATEDFLADRLTSLLPGSAFAGEERGLRALAESGALWVCDPIDGTVNYVRGLPHWCVAAGLMYGGSVVLGVVYNPVLRETYWAGTRLGAWRNGERIRTLHPKALAREDMLCASTGALQEVALDELVLRIRCLGSIAMELCLVADGRAVAAVGCGEGIADLAACLCLCAEAGAEATDLSGHRVDPLVLLEQWRTRRPFLVASETARGLLLPLLKLRRTAEPRA